MDLQDIKNKTIEMIKDLSNRGLLIEKQTEVATNGLNLIDIYIYIVNQARNEQEVNVIANLIKGLQEGFNFQRVPTITTNTLTILEPSKYQKGEISPTHNKVIICDNTIEKENWEKINNKIDRLNKEKPFDYKKEIETLKKEQFILAPDNLDVLNNLLCDKTIQDNGGIDIIYIDPPYNTGNSSLGYRDLREQNEWLNFMKARLEVASDLLSNDGIIFISIDDNMHSYLKIICDEVFGKKQFVGNIIWDKMNFQQGAHNIQKNHEYVLVYSKNDLSNKKVLFNVDSQNLKFYTDDFGTYYREYPFDTSFGNDKLVDRPSMGYIFYYNPKTNEKILSNNYVKDKDIIKENNIDKVYSFDKALISKGFVPIYPPLRKGNVLGRWSRGMVDAKNLLEKNLLDFVKTKSESYKIYPKKYIEDGFSKTNDHPIQSIIKYSSSDGTKVLGEILNNKKFGNPKNVDMIKFLISSYKAKKDPLILDFFAGSGTTAQSILELNNEDKQKRKIILATKKFDFIPSLNSWENIGENVLIERIFRISYGTNKDGKKLSKKECPWLSHNTPFNIDFDYLETKQYDISLESQLNPYEIIDLSVYGYIDILSLDERKKIINAKFNILLNHLNK